MYPAYSRYVAGIAKPFPIESSTSIKGPANETQKPNYFPDVVEVLESQKRLYRWRYCRTNTSHRKLFLRGLLMSYANWLKFQTTKHSVAETYSSCLMREGLAFSYKQEKGMHVFTCPSVTELERYAKLFRRSYRENLQLLDEGD